MAWIPLLLASWIVLDVVIVAIVLALASRRRRFVARAAEPLAELPLLPPEGTVQVATPELPSLDSKGPVQVTTAPARRAVPLR
jgi:hypothetical protein